MNDDTQVRPTESADRAIVGSVGDAGGEEDGFLSHERMDEYRRRWSDVQAGFVDDPQRAVGSAQELVTSMMTELTETFSRTRSRLEEQWKNAETDTEELRVALQRYRSFFNRLLR